MYQATPFLYLYTICLQIEWLPHSTPLNTAVILLHPAGIMWESWVEVELWLTPCSRQTVTTCDACNLFSWKCFVAWLGLAAVWISHHTCYLSGRVSGNVCVLIWSSELHSIHNYSLNLCAHSLHGHLLYVNIGSLCFTRECRGLRLSRCVSQCS